MKTRLYILLIPFTLSLIAAGILVHLALQNGLVIQWVAAACLHDRVVFSPDFMKPLRSFALTYGEKP